MKKKEKLIMAAVAVTMQLPCSAMDIIKVSQTYGVNHHEVMTEVADMLIAQSSANKDMED